MCITCDKKTPIAIVIADIAIIVIKILFAIPIASFRVNNLMVVYQILDMLSCLVDMVV